MDLTAGPVAALLRNLGRPSRRQFQLLLGAGLASAVGCKRDGAAAPLAADASRTPAPGPRGDVLDAEEWAAIEAATERILPSGAGVAGAREAGVVRFIDRQLGTPALAPIVNAVKLAARLLDRWAQETHGGRLARLPPGQQDEIVGALARGKIPWKGLPQKQMFRVLHTLTLEGYLADPVHGGNAGMVGWKAIGFREPHLRQPAPPGTAPVHRHGG